MKKFFSMVRAFLHYRIGVLIYEAHLERFVIAFRQWLYIQKLKRKEHINVVFFPMNIPMWKYQHLYELLAKDKRFRLYIFLAPATTFTYEARCADLQRMRDYFTQHNMPYVDYELEKGKDAVAVSSIVDPDILFYAQPNGKVVDPQFNFIHFQHKLVCHIPYGMYATNADYCNYNLRFFNIAWKLYFPTKESKKLSKQYANNKGRNVVIIGNPTLDNFKLPIKHNPWKNQNPHVKRIIWAPHFTIIEGVGFAQRSNFLNMAEFMQQLAKEYSDKITIAFKPNPRLFSELERHPEWGEKRAREYYNFWESGPTTQLETGDFIDLFKGSDAMIHDSASFTFDYLYVNKPVLYDNPDIEGAKATANETGKAAYDAHYRVSSNEDIKRFIDDVVLAGNDPMKAKREEYYKKYLLPPNGKSVAQNIYDDIIKSLGLK